MVLVVTEQAQVKLRASTLDRDKRRRCPYSDGDPETPLRTPGIWIRSA